MADYPALPVAPGSYVEPVSEHELDVAVDGSFRVGYFEEVESYYLHIRHELLTTEDRNALIAFYKANRLEPIRVNIAGIEYEGLFLKEPLARSDEVTRWSVEVELIGNEYVEPEE